jgi:hypothetical protein
MSAYWISDDSVADAVELAATLSEAFSETGVWPLLWRYGEDPSNYTVETVDLDAIDAVNVESLLRDGWARFAQQQPDDDVPFGHRLPGLAAQTPREDASAANPFSRVPRDDPYAGRLLLVPCNRPADAISAIGELAWGMPAPLISAVMRSWEERFGAVLVAVEPSHTWMAVQAPPRDPKQALLLAAEYSGFSPFPADRQPNSLIECAATLQRRLASAAG